ncbi:sentrin-specific protease 8 [Nasonia vitripennis]|uniref:Ubiquitin-like protease family profile domain-containing protein n=1 Tax=Nasonia vitripennis TaxID=7425 RepID=A0A7M7IV45_NASVI|nr:sentrin-specific protease 8 [Nasonia vitripennis]XP_008202260.1 sentrin-specific protease 8 [Nasonia vitripennis]XP_016842593.1 sentrin-specific protease 8 [Nasonia vitripennis]
MSKSQNKENDLILSYHDCILRRDDVNLLNGPYWLNDAVIGFYFEYLGQKYIEASSKLLFISPELTQLLKLTDPHEYPIFLDPIEAKKKEFIFFPVNDCNSRNTAGGSHWSLMVFSKTERTCFYFDSSYGLNTSVARDFSKGVMSYLLDKGTGQFVEVNCPQQENGYDCGLFVLCYADIITEFVLKTSNVEGCDCDNVNSLVFEKRKSLKTLIERLKESEH